jgi:hypothetical protein
MPDWFGPLLAGIALFAFLGYAFWRSRRVKPDSYNPDNWPPATGDTSGSGGGGGGD